MDKSRGSMIDTLWGRAAGSVATGIRPTAASHRALKGSRAVRRGPYPHRAPRCAITRSSIARRRHVNRIGAARPTAA